MPSSVRVVGADAVGKKSFVLALGAKEQTAQRRHVALQYLWSRNGRRSKTLMHIVRSRDEALYGHGDDNDNDNDRDDDDEVFVLLFDLTRRGSLAAVTAQWAHLLDTTGRRFLVGTHVDCTSKRKVSLAEVREILGDFHAYEEVCCRPGHSGDKGMLRVQLTLTQWISAGPARTAVDLPLARASICGGFPRPVVTMMMPARTLRSSPRSPTGQQPRMHAADVRPATENESFRLDATTSAGAGDVKLRTISKAIYDIRSAVAEKSKVLAKYRDRRVTHWLTRSRYFGPTESSRHKRWHEEQKKRQLLAQCHVHYHHGGHMLRQSNTIDACLQEERGRSVSYPNKCEVPDQESSAQCSPVEFSSPSSSEREESPASCCLEQKGFAQPTERTKQRQLEAESAREQKKRLAAKRALRKQRRAASGDIYERSTTSPAIFDSYFNCYDEMDVPSQLQSSMPSLDRRRSVSRHSPASSTGTISFTSREHVSFETGSLTLAGVQHSTEGLSLEAEPVDCMRASTQFESSVPVMMDPPAPLRRRPSVQNQHSVNNVAPGSLEHTFLSDTVLKSTTQDKAPSVLILSPLCPAMATDGSVFPMSTLRRATCRSDASVSRANGKCRPSSTSVDCSNIKGDGPL